MNVVGISNFKMDLIIDHMIWKSDFENNYCYVEIEIKRQGPAGHWLSRRTRDQHSHEYHGKKF